MFTYCVFVYSVFNSVPIFNSLASAGQKAAAMDIDEVNGAFTGEMGIGCDDYDDYDVAPSSPISSRQEGDVSEKEY